MMKEPMRSRVVRASDELWKAAQVRAEERGESVSTAVRRFLTAYIDPNSAENVAADMPDGIEPLMVMVVVDLQSKPAEELAERVARKAAESARTAIYARLGKEAP